MTPAPSAKKVMTRPFAWWLAAKASGEIKTDHWDWDVNTERAAEAAGLDTDDPDLWFAYIIEVSPVHAALQAGDFAVWQRDGADVHFVRVPE